MRISTLSIGDELLLGEVVDTNACHIAAKLFDLGARVLRHATVGDCQEAIAAALQELALASDAVVVTGGLGPTPDDMTAAAAARAAGRPLVASDQALQHLASFALRTPFGLHPANQKQALLPAGCTLIPNPLGTACGFTFRLGSAQLFFLPGVPYEMERMLEDTVLPALAEPGGGERRITLKLFGISEAAAAASIEGCLAVESPVELAYGVKSPEIHLILRSPRAHGELLEAAAGAIRERLGAFIFAQGEQTMDTVLASLFRESGLTLALAESCSGGMIAARITAEAGSSAYFMGGEVTYSNQAKSRMLQVPAELIAAKGAVSAEVASAMATSARRLGGVDLALSVTGIAGPSGGTPEKPVGTVFVALADDAGCRVKRYHFIGDRTAIRSITTFTALNWLRKYLLNLQA